MSEMTAQERIAELLYAYGAWASGDIYRTRNFEDDAEAVGECIAIVREALLGEQAVAVMAERLSWADAYSETMQDDQEWRKDAVSALTELVDAAFGPGKTLDTDRV